MPKPWQWQSPDTRLEHIKYARQLEEERAARLDEQDNQRLSRFKIEYDMEVQRRDELDRRDTIAQEMEVEQERKRRLDEKMMTPLPPGPLPVPGDPSFEPGGRMPTTVRPGEPFQFPPVPAEMRDTLSRTEVSLFGQPRPSPAPRDFQQWVQDLYLWTVGEGMRQGLDPEKAHERAITKIEPSLERLESQQGRPGRFERVMGRVLEPVATGIGWLERQDPIIGGPFARTPEDGFPAYDPEGRTAFERGAEISRPVAQEILPVAAAPFEAGEVGFEEVTGVPARGKISGKIKGQIAEDVLTEIINPAALVLVAPIVMQGTQGLRGGALAAQMSSNLLATGMEPTLVRGTLRGLTALRVRGLAALKDMPRAVRETKVVQDAARLIREGEVGGGRMPRPREPPPVRLAEAAPEDPVDKLTGLIRGAKKPRRETELMRHAELQRRIARASAVIEKGGPATPEERLIAAKGQLRGEQPRAAFEPVRPALAEDETQRLIGRALNYDFGPGHRFENINAADATTRLLLGEMPTNSELALLERVFGPELIKAIRAKRALGERAWENFVDMLNLPRTVLATLDHSFPGRQGIKLAPSYPREWTRSARAGFNALVRDEKYALSLNEQLLADSTPIRIRAGEATQTVSYSRLKEMSGLYHAPLREAAPLAEREEMFISRWARVIPGVKRAERAYITSGNAIRSDALKKVVVAATESGEAIELETVKGLANLFNRASGRGTLGPLNQFAPILSGLQFAPRYRAAAWEWPLQVFHPNPVVRKEAARQLVSFFTAGATVLAAVELSGLGHVELDARSTDFGKIRLGNQRIDFWAHNQQITRSLAQLAQGERKTAMGDIVPADRQDVAYRYFRSGASPAASAAIDAYLGETMVGEEMEATPRGARTQLFNRLVPLAWQDIVDSAREEGLRGGLISTLALGGIGIQTYETFSERRNAAFRQEMDTDFDPKNGGHWAILRERPALAEFAEPSPQMRETETFLIEQMEGLKLPEMAQAMSAGNMEAAPQFAAAWEDYETVRANAAARMAMDRDVFEDSDYQRWRDISPNNYRDPQTFEIDWDSYYHDREAAFAKLPEIMRAALRKVRAPDPDVQEWAERYVEARELRRALFEIPRHRGVSTEEEQEMDDFLADVTKARLYWRENYGAETSVVAGIRRVAEMQDKGPNFVQWAILLRSGTNTERKLRTPEYNAFLVNSEDKLRPFFPRLYETFEMAGELFEERQSANMMQSNASFPAQ